MRVAAHVQDLSDSDLEPHKNKPGMLPDDVVESRQAGKQPRGRQEPGLSSGRLCGS